MGTRILIRPNSKRQTEASGIHAWKFRKTEGGHLSSIKLKQETFGFASTKVPEIP